MKLATLSDTFIGQRSAIEEIVSNGNSLLIGFCFPVRRRLLATMTEIFPREP